MNESVLRKRILPSGRPCEKIKKYKMADPTWLLEWNHFNNLIKNEDYGINQKELYLNKIFTHITQLGKLKFEHK